MSYYLQAGDFAALFDAGYSDVYLRNAAALGLNLAPVDTVVLSHGHNDHTGGLKYFPVAAPQAKLVGHPDILEPKRLGALAIGCPGLSVGHRSGRHHRLFPRRHCQYL